MILHSFNLLMTASSARRADFIATPLPEVPREVRAHGKGFPHQSEEERKGDMDVPDEGESIAKTPRFAANDPNAAPEMGGSKCAFCLDTLPPPLQLLPRRLRRCHAGHAVE
jgi:hypothetical protein